MAEYDGKVFTGDKMKPVLDNLATEYTKKISWGLCSSNTATKTVTVGSKKTFSLDAGAVIAITFAGSVQADSTLNVNSTGAKNIIFQGSNITSGIVNSGDTVFLEYTGQAWKLIDTGHTHRAIKVGGVEKLSSTSSTPLDFTGDGSVTVTYENNAVKIHGDATDISGKQDTISWYNGSSATAIKVGPVVVRAGSNVTFTESSTNGVNISATDTTYDAADDSNLGLVKVQEVISSTTGYSGKIAILSGSVGAGKIYVKDATATTGGVLTDALAVKLNGIEAGATNYRPQYYTETNTEATLDPQSLIIAATETAFNGEVGFTNNVSFDNTVAFEDAVTVGSTIDLGDSATADTKAITDNSTNVATTAFVQSLIADKQIGAATFKGSVGTGASDVLTPDSGNTPFSSLTDYKKGWYWVVATAGTYCGSNGTGGYSCEAGDFIFCVNDKASSYSSNDFSVIQNNIEIITTSEVTTLWNAAFN